MNHHVTMSPELLKYIADHKVYADAAAKAWDDQLDAFATPEYQDAVKKVHGAKLDLSDHSRQAAKDLLITPHEFRRAYKFRQAEFKKDG